MDHRIRELKSILNTKSNSRFRNRAREARIVLWINMLLDKLSVESKKIFCQTIIYQKMSLKSQALVSAMKPFCGIPLEKKLIRRRQMS